MKITFSTTEYELAHGKKPSGRGSWAFYRADTGEGWFASPCQTFTEAKREFLTMIRDRDHGEGLHWQDLSDFCIRVCP